MEKSIKLELIFLIVLIGFFIAVTFHFIEIAYLHNVYPLNSFILRPGQGIQFNDYYFYYQWSEHLDPYSEIVGDIKSVYFPFALLVAYLFTIFDKNVSLVLYLSFFVCFLLCFNYYYLRDNNEHKNTINNLKNLVIITFMTYPFLFAFERANFEIIVFIFLSVFVFLYQRGRQKASIPFLAMAGAMKLYPLTFLVLFISDKRYKEAVYVVLWVVLLTLVSLIAFKPGVLTSINELLSNLSLFKTQYIIQNRGLVCDTSLFQVLKLGSCIINHVPWMGIGASSVFLSIYSLAGVVLFGLLTLYIIFIERVFWKKVALLVFSMLLLPQVSFDYKLLHIYLILYMFSIDDSDTSKISVICYSVMLALLFIPKNYARIYHEVTIAGPINVLIMVIMTIMIVVQGFQARKKLEIKKIFS